MRHPHPQFSPVAEVKEPAPSVCPAAGNPAADLPAGPHPAWRGDKNVAGSCCGVTPCTAPPLFLGGRRSPGASRALLGPFLLGLNFVMPGNELAVGGGRRPGRGRLVLWSKRRTRTPESRAQFLALLRRRRGGRLQLGSGAQARAAPPPPRVRASPCLSFPSKPSPRPWSRAAVTWRTAVAAPGSQLVNE